MSVLAMVWLLCGMILLVLPVGYADDSCALHHTSDGSTNRCRPRECPAGTEPVCHKTTEPECPEAVCKPCDEGFYMEQPTMSYDMKSCTQHFECLAVGVTVSQEGNSTMNTVCMCDLEGGYQPSNRSLSQDYGLLHAKDCISRTVADTSTVGLNATTVAPSVAKGSSGSMNVIGIILTIIGGSVFLAVIVIAIIYVCKKRQWYRKFKEQFTNGASSVQNGDQNQVV